ncbi:hypothetical protein [endosymbiont GvMRE of Glomus versiforme]|uniref:hypothetical protein n=1 Tax=endosymbiont GvMRE of Glomus versiforme TaxID=2039283 RepID=UPI000EE91232|nr:hypothetical protein [endosymbiont GvMRE of Glomus versiforme]RHZ36085.1 hypothetical protein GvMRE_Ic3g123 [endosymbiont GvMRE of Glomus versiforme]RHZ36773.1 hypothetical protein GvMRE_I2g170 [endosymbiont GvMRE of Glomus versiforme]
MSKGVKCSKGNPCMDCQKKQQELLAKIEDWEVKKKEKIEKFETIEFEWCNNRRDNDNKIQYSSFGDYSQGYSYEKCSECGKDSLHYIHKSNQYGDTTKFLKNKSCNCEIGTKENLGHSVSESSNQTKSNKSSNSSLNSTNTHRESNPSKPKNYLPWILGGIGVLGLIGIVVYFLTRKKGEK